ncbi:MAG TPA: cation:proton antiporter [Chitinophagales bacterium]|nr:cation:proton antiporter [Chitinophagales bacterium]
MKAKIVIYYVVTIGLFSLFMYWVIREGKVHEAKKITEQITEGTKHSAFELVRQAFTHNVTHPLAILILQIITIIITARLFGYLFNKIGQPTVIGEIVAGIFLGPSFAGAFLPEFSHFLFPAQSLSNLQFLSQVGLIFFMFVIGMELDLNVLKTKAKDAIVISHASIVIPFALGIGLSYFLYLEFSPANVSFLSFSLFMGIAMSITAFPVLARIIQERGLTRTRLGTIAITAAATDDITAWCLLAAVIAIVKAGDLTGALFTIVMAIAYIVVMVNIIRPFLKRVGEIYSNKETLGPTVTSASFLILLCSSYLTEIIGIHALFGAFFAGVIMPPNVNFRKILINKVEDIALVILLPLFFVFTGLRTQIGLLNEPHLWNTCGLVILVAIAGKFGGSAFSAKVIGQSWRDSLSIGALMNTRGLMELVVLNIGYDIGVLSPEIFAMMVLMALATTFMTGPALVIIEKFLPEKIAEVAVEAASAGMKILISFANPVKGKKLLRLASYLSKSQNGIPAITTLHLHPNPDINPFAAAEFEKESFQPINEEARSLGINVTPIFKISHDVNKEILNTVNHGDYDMLLVGVGPSLYKGTFLGNILGFTARALKPEKLIETITGKERWLKDDSLLSENIMEFIDESRCSVGIFIDKDFSKVDTVLVPLLSRTDLFLTSYIKQLVRNDKITINILVLGGVQKDPVVKEELNSIVSLMPHRIILLGERTIDKTLLSIQDLMIISFNSWRKLVESQNLWLANAPSTLIIKP